MLSIGIDYVFVVFGQTVKRAISPNALNRSKAIGCKIIGTDTVWDFSVTGNVP